MFTRKLYGEKCSDVLRFVPRAPNGCVFPIQSQSSPSKQTVLVDALPHGGPQGFASMRAGLPTAAFPQGIWRGKITNLGCGFVLTLTVPALRHAAGL